MFKVLLSFLIVFLFIGDARSQNRDTVVVYYKNYLNPQKVSTLDSADFVRIVYPPDSSEEYYNIREYYKNGKVKLIGKMDVHSNISTFLLVGNCISYYPTGKKQNISYYGDDGKKADLEYSFRPDGNISYVKKWIVQPQPFLNNAILWECYDDKGNQICENGNGKWIIYDTEGKNIILHGQVINGVMDGEWDGAAMGDDSIKYICKYNKGKSLSAISYSNGLTYSFSADVEYATYKNGNLFDFLNTLRMHFKLPRDINGNKINIDTVHVSFIIGKDGRVSNVETLGTVNPVLNSELNVAATKCHNWNPSKYFGIPVRSRIIMSLKIKERNIDDKVLIKSIDFKRELDFLNPGLDVAHPIDKQG
jgi:hypothetical protein